MPDAKLILALGWLTGWSMPLSFRNRLTIWYMLVLATLLVAAAMVLITTLQGMAERELDATLWVLGVTEAEGVTDRLHDRGLSSPDNLAIHDIDYSEITGYNDFRVQKYVMVVDQSHRVADFSLNLQGHTLPVDDRLITGALSGEVQYRTSEVQGIGRLRLIYVPVRSEKSEPFVVVVGVPTEFVGAEIGTLTRRLAIIVLIVLALAGVSGWLLARRAWRPVAETAVAVQRITDRNLHERIPEPRTNDEIDYLIRVFNQLLARLDHAFEVQRRFTADASHEICTPLTVLKGETEVALLETRTPEDYESLLKSNLEEIERLSRLTNNLLLLARSDAGEQQIEKELLILNELAEDTYQRLRPLADERGVGLSLNSSQTVLIEGDYFALQQVIVNLVSNALRYTPHGGYVWLGVGQTPEGSARFEVTDTGVGIPPEALPHIFDRFYRADNARAHERTGSGLGLSICHVVTTAHQGRIEVTSTPGRGSHFTLILPAASVLDQSVEIHDMRAGEPSPLRR